jgi:hypothetical protein
MQVLALLCILYKRSATPVRDAMLAAIPLEILTPLAADRAHEEKSKPAAQLIAHLYPSAAPERAGQ